MKNTYSEMKDSGVAWIGDIPQTWKKGRIKYNYFLKGRIGWQGLKADEFIEDGPYYLVTGTDFENGRIAWDRCYHISEQRFIEAPEIHIRKGDLLITKDGTVGKVALIDSLPHKASLNSHLLIVRPTSKLYDNGFLFWIFQSSIFEKYCGLSQNGSIMASLSQEKMSNFSFPLPSLPEQTAIAAYLDEKCGTIDEIIAEAKASIEEYKAWKSSVIFEAVTKGLDPHAEMKDSGVDIIGLMPKHWNLCRQRFLCKTTTGDHDTQDAEPEGAFPFYVRSPIIERSNTYTFDGEGVLMAGDGAGAGRVFHYATGKYAIHQRVYCFYDFKGILPRFYHYFMENLFCAEMDKGSAKSTVPSVRLPMLKDFNICLPSLTEQANIITALDEKCAVIDGIIAEKEALIADMEAYKKSLIFETVTGKRKVC